MKKTVIVIGAGASGTIAAGFAGLNGADVIIIEKNKKICVKIRITGKGRCNITNNCSKEKFIENIPKNSKFLYSSINTFSPQDTVDFFTKQGLKLKTERGNRVFPISNNANDVADTLEKFINENNCKIINGKVEKLIIKNNKCLGVVLDNEEKIFSDSVIIASGGKSYPRTGSTGDGYIFAKNSGHKITKLKPSLVPLISNENWCKKLQGLSLKNVSIEILDTVKNKLIYKELGEMLFTHFGVSGPLILSASSHMNEMSENRYLINLDLKPGLTLDQLDKRLQKDFIKCKNKDYANSLNDILPKKIIPTIVDLSEIPSKTKCHEITKEMRIRLANLLKKLKISVKNFRPIEEAIITSGGVCTSTINPKTMESKIIKSLYFAGEIIDVDGYTGGFNLQIAFSTGYVAGNFAVKE